MTRQAFIHRHDRRSRCLRFLRPLRPLRPLREPSVENIFLLGMMAGASLVAIAVAICCHYNHQ